MRKWRLISTAPRNTHSILVWCPERMNTYIVYWTHSNSTWTHFGSLGRTLTEEPTHWMPLPEPPP